MGIYKPSKQICSAYLGGGGGSMGRVSADEQWISAFVSTKTVLILWFQPGKSAFFNMAVTESDLDPKV